MKKKELAALKALSVGELETKLADLKKELFGLRFQHATNQLDNPKQLTFIRRDIARVETLLREKQSNG